MPIKRPQFANGKVYHIIIRAVGDTLVFKEESDYYRGIYSIYEFNTINPVEIRLRRRFRKRVKASGEPFSDARDPFVETLAFCLMPNHIHLLLKQIKDRGISEFVRKFGVGEAGYFNKKYSRKGPLFAKFRAVHIKDDDQLNTIFVYIHSNPISLIEPGWKEAGVKNPEKVMQFLENYKWSSYQDYISSNRWGDLLVTDIILKQFKDWVKYDIEYVRDQSLLLDMKILILTIPAVLRRNGAH